MSSEELLPRPGALITGALALTFPNGTPRHRIIGKAYLAAWLVLAPCGLMLGLRRPGISAFEVLTWLGLAQVAYAYGVIFFRKRIGRTWVQKHYSGMVGSMAGLVVATVNQVLPQLGVEYPLWVFLLMAASPFLWVPFVIRWLDRRHGFAPAKRAKGAAQPQQAQV